MKHIFNLCALFVAAAFLAACDPTEKDYSNNALTYSSEELAGLVSFTQADKDGNPASDGNYITYYAKTGVTIYNYNSAGEENVLASGTQGSFKIAPSRGSDPNQTVYIRALNPDNTTVEGSVTLTVAVAADLTAEMKLLCSNSGSKTWKWNTSIDLTEYPAAAWGNGGYKSTDGESFANGANNWFGVSGTDNFEGQMQHSDTGVLTGEEDVDAYMVFSTDGSLKKYDKDGNLLVTGTYEISDYNASSIGTEWSIGTLKTSEGAILWPFEINKGGLKPTSFDILS